MIEIAHHVLYISVCCVDYVVGNPLNEAYLPKSDFRHLNHLCVSLELDIRHVRNWTLMSPELSVKAELI